jgi:CheY-like chemotaxis protein
MTMRVLVVEDASRLRAIVTQRLREDGYAVDGAGTGAEAISLAAGGSYDAIVLDLRLPDIDGMDVCGRLRSARCWTPILMLTARDGLRDRVAGLDRGADDYLTKPFEFPELLGSLPSWSFSQLSRCFGSTKPFSRGGHSVLSDPRIAYRVEGLRSRSGRGQNQGCESDWGINRPARTTLNLSSHAESSLWPERLLSLGFWESRGRLRPRAGYLSAVDRGAGR